MGYAFEYCPFEETVGEGERNAGKEDGKVIYPCVSPVHRRVVCCRSKLVAFSLELFALIILSSCRFLPVSQCFVRLSRVKLSNVDAVVRVVMPLHRDCCPIIPFWVWKRLTFRCKSPLYVVKAAL